MNKVKCLINSDFVSCGNIVIKKGIICDILEDYGDYVWIDPYIPEIGEEIPLPILKAYITYV